MRINAIFSNANEALFNKIMAESVPTLSPKSEFDTMKAQQETTFTHIKALNNGEHNRKEEQKEA